MYKKLNLLKFLKRFCRGKKYVIHINNCPSIRSLLILILFDNKRTLNRINNQLLIITLFFLLHIGCPSIIIKLRSQIFYRTSPPSVAPTPYKLPFFLVRVDTTWIYYYMDHTPDYHNIKWTV